MRLLLLFSMILLSTRFLFGQAENNLPLITQEFDSTDYLFFHITGDGGWRGFDIKMSEECKVHQLSYVILNAFKYFWTTKTPDELVTDMIPVLRDYLKKWNKKRLILSGFSFGAEVIPFFYNRLPDDLKDKVTLIVMITPASTSDFTIHLTDMVGVEHHYAYDVVKEVEKIHTPRVFVIFGEKEDSTFPEHHQQANCVIDFVKGSHHFTDAKTVMDRIVQELHSP